MQADAQDTRGVRPSSAAVLAELKRLRQREGLTSERMRNLGESIMALPAVDEEIRRGAFHEDDRHLAATNLVDCTITKRTLSLEQQQLLRVVLNLPPIRNSLHEVQYPRLEDRVKYGLSIFYWSDNKYLMRRVNAAMELLANTLVQLDYSPCSVNEPDPAIEIIGQGLSIRTILMLCTAEQREEAREELARLAVMNSQRLASFYAKAQAAVSPSLTPLDVLACVVHMFVPEFALVQTVGAISDNKLVGTAKYVSNFLENPGSTDRSMGGNIPVYKGAGETRSIRATTLDDLARLQVLANGVALIAQSVEEANFLALNAWQLDVNRELHRRMYGTTAGRKTPDPNRDPVSSA